VLNEPAFSAGPILVCFAVKEEAAFFRDFVSDHPEVKMLVTGMGATNAQQALASAMSRLQELPQAVITSGFAGGLSPAARPGDALVESDSAQLREIFVAAGARPARFHCCARIASTAAEKRTLTGTGADAVEMESQIIRDACRQAGLLCATVRVILDPVEEDLPLDFNTLLDERRALAPGRLAAALLKNPVAIRGLIRLRRQSRVAARRLATVLEGGLARVLRLRLT
jgi:nucleoside phosphorylase